MFLTEQKSDLEKSKNELNGIIESMEELMKEHFGKQFQEINESFSLVFSELFGGGKGELTLSDQAMFLKAVLKLSHSFRVKVRRISICIRAVKSRLLLLHFCLQYFE